MHLKLFIDLDTATFSSFYSLPPCNSEYLKKFNAYSWKRAKMKRILNIPEEPEKRLMLLSQAVHDTSLTGLPQHLKDYVLKSNGQPMEYVLTIGYEQLGVDEVEISSKN